MKRILYSILLIVSLSSCATLAQWSPATAYQKTKPLPGQPEREIRIGALIFDIALCGVPLAVDFATKKIYREHPKGYHLVDGVWIPKENKVVSY